jgi:hypothetical protein
VENQEGDEFLLPGTWSAARKAAVREYAEASEQLEAQMWGYHCSSLYAATLKHDGASVLLMFLAMCYKTRQWSGHPHPPR